MTAPKAGRCAPVPASTTSWRHVRRHRRAGRAAAAPAQRPRRRGAERAVREQRLPGRAAHDAVRRHRPAGGTDARAHLGLGVYDVFTVQGGEQIFLAAVSDTQWSLLCTEFGYADLLADSRLASNNDRVRARRLADAGAARAAGARTRRPNWPRASTATACPTRRSRGRRTCSTTRTCAPPAAWRPSPCRPTPAAPAIAFDTRMALLPLAIDGQRCRCGSRRRPSASTAWRCCGNWATAATRSRPCARPASWACLRPQAKQA